MQYCPHTTTSILGARRRNALPSRGGIFFVDKEQHLLVCTGMLEFRLQSKLWLVTFLVWFYGNQSSCLSSVVAFRPSSPQFTHRDSARAAWSSSQTAAVVASAMIFQSIVLPIPSCLAIGDVDKGKVLFDDNCASCHIAGSNVINEQRTLQRDALEKYGIGVEQAEIKGFVTNSMRHKNLVFFKVEGGKLNPQQWEDVTTYVADQAAGTKW